MEWVRAARAKSLVGTTFRITTSKARPTILAAPASGPVVEAGDIRFYWSTASESHAALQIALDPDFRSLLVDLPKISLASSCGNDRFSIGLAVFPLIPSSGRQLRWLATRPSGSNIPASPILRYSLMVNRQGNRYVA